MKKVIFTDQAAASSGWYSQAIKTGRFVFVSGALGKDPVTGELVTPGNISAQTEQALMNLKSVLEAAGSCLEDVVKTTVFIDDIDKFDHFNDVYKKYFPVDPPARSTIEVGRFEEGVCVEIEATAYVD